MCSARDFCYVAFLAAIIATVSCDETRQKHALVFGGNGFIAAEVVLRLMAEGYIVSTTNRGNWYWDNPVRVKPRIHRHYPCDRDDGILNCWDLRNYVREVDFFDVVIDFTAFRAKTVTDAATALAGKAGLYVLISSDSVYMVSRRDELRNADPDSEVKGEDEDRPWKEEDAVRPYSATLQERLQENDPYGHDKFGCEEALVKQREEGGIPYVILRLPDVLGPRDTTNRWWPYQLWLQFYDRIKVPIRFSEKLWNIKTSFIFVDDVADAISLILSKNTTDIVDGAYNLAFEEATSVPDLLKLAASSMNIDGVKFEMLDPRMDDNLHAPIPGVYYLFPSVDFGSIDITRAKTLLGWKPTPLKAAMKAITTFYKKAFGKFPLQRDKAISSVMINVVTDEQKASVRAAFDAAIQRAEKETEEEEQQNKNKQEL